MGSFIGLHTALTGIRAGQRGLDTASHNVSNVNTPGYTRQRVDLASRIPWHSEVGPIGTGVDVNGVRRLREAFLDTRVRTVGENYAAADTTAAMLQRAEDVLGEPDNGVSSLLGDVFDAFDDLAISPADPATRAAVIASIDALASRFNAVDRGWSQLAADARQRLDLGVEDVNAKLARIDELNKAVGSFGGQDVPNDLLDERDLILDELASSVGATSSLGRDDLVTVTIGSRTVVTPGPPPAHDALEHAADTFSVDGIDVTTEIGGELGALHQFLTGELDGIRTDFDTLAATIVDELNTQHAAGYSAVGTGIPLLQNATAAGVAPDGALTIERLAAAMGAFNAHDGRNAQAIADLREGDLDEAVRQFTVRLGQQVAEATRTADGHEALMTSATVARRSAHSVSLDEEMISLVQFQRAVEASARVMTAVDQALDVLVNRTGVVGR